MPDASDMELLRDYSRHGSEAAFAELVQRHISLVYSVALRHVGIAAQAEEITQAVFIILARKAACLRPDTILEGWLHETTRLTALSFLRGERRRQFREQEAYMQSSLPESTDASIWNQLAPLLDEALSGLGRKDRDAVVLRFFKDKSVRDVATTLRVNEAAAQRRILRALEKLHRYFSRHGISSTTAIIAGVISANSIQAAPVALAKSVTAVAIAKGAVASGSTLTLIQGALKVMAWTKAKTAIVVGAGMLLAAGTATVTFQQIKQHTSEDSWRFANIDGDRVAQLPPEVKILPTKFQNSGNMEEGPGPDADKFVGINQPVVNIVWAAYNWPQSRVVFADEEPTNRYDFITTLGQGSREALKQALKDKLGLVGHRETRDADVLLLKMRNPNAPGLHPPVPGASYSYLHHDDTWFMHRREIKWANGPVSRMADFLESGSKWPIIDETGMTNHWSIDITWEDSDPQDSEHKALQKVLLEQLGLELVLTNMPMEMLVVEKVK